MTFAIVAVVYVPQSALAFGSPKINAPKSFQAQFTLQVGGKPPEHGMMFYSHGRIREEIAASEGAPKSTTIIDPISKTIYEVVSDKKVFKTPQVITLTGTQLGLSNTIGTDFANPTTPAFAGEPVSASTSSG